MTALHFLAVCRYYWLGMPFWEAVRLVRLMGGPN